MTINSKRNQQVSQKITKKFITVIVKKSAKLNKSKEAIIKKVF